jgi:hypothetical protein
MDDHDWWHEHIRELMNASGLNGILFCHFEHAHTCVMWSMETENFVSHYFNQIYKIFI